MGFLGDYFISALVVKILIRHVKTALNEGVVEVKLVLLEVLEVDMVDLPHYLLFLWSQSLFRLFHCNNHKLKNNHKFRLFD